MAPRRFSQIMVPSHDTVKWLEKVCRESAGCTGWRENFARIFHIKRASILLKNCPWQKIITIKVEKLTHTCEGSLEISGGNYKVSINALKMSKSFSMIILTHLTQFFSTMDFGRARPEYSGRRWAHITYRTSKHHSYLDGLHVAWQIE